MNKISLCFILLIITKCCLFGQQKHGTGPGIENNLLDLQRNKVESITYTDYYYKDKKKKNLSDKAIKHKKELFDNLGRNIEVIYYNDSTGMVSGRSKYYYADSMGIAMFRIEYYDRNDSLIKVYVAQEKDGDMIFLRVRGNISCFGHYKFKYNKNGLIEEAVWYIPRKGIWANEDMVPLYVTKLIYSYLD